MRVLLILLLCFSLSGCCMIAGMGMKNAREESKARQDAMHDKIGNVFDRIAP